MRQRNLLRDALASTPGDVTRLVRRLDDDAARRVLAHLVAVEQATTATLRRVLAADRAALTDEHVDAADNGHDPVGRRERVSSAGPGQLLQRFEAMRRETLCHLDDLPDDGWARAVDHEVLGRTRVITVVRRLLDHDLVHLGELADARPRTRPDPRPEHASG